MQAVAVPMRLISCGLLAVVSLLARDAHTPQIPVFTYQVIHVYPHDPNAYTEGLFYLNGYLYESTGLQGHSSIRKVRLETGEPILSHSLPQKYFGEGITYYAHHVIGLTWKSHVGFLYDLHSFTLHSQFQYPGEGWALTRNDHELVMSDGTSQLRFLDPVTFHELRRIRVTAQGEPVSNLNELEWVRNAILANVWQTNRIARIDPATGNVIAWIDLTGLLPARAHPAGPAQSLNGIAYDPATDRLFVTGKLWPSLFEIRILNLPMPKGTGSKPQPPGLSSTFGSGRPVSK